MEELLTDLATGLIFIVGICFFIGAASLIYWAWNSGRKDKNRSE